MLNGPFSFRSAAGAPWCALLNFVRVWCSMRKMLFAGLSILSLLAVPAESFARDRHGDWGRYDGRSYRHHNDHGDAVAAGVIGLAIGAVIGSALADDRDHYRGGPPRAYDRYNEGPYHGDDGYSRDDRYRDEGYDRGQYQGQYQGGQCFRRELVWDPRTRQNIEVTHPYPC